MTKIRHSKGCNLFEYKTYKGAILALLEIDHENERGKRTALANAINCQPAYLSRVLNGDADLSFEQAEAVTRYFVLNKVESSYFLALVGEARAGTPDLRAYWHEQKSKALADRLELKNRVRLTNHLNEGQQYIYFSQWYYAAIHAAVSVPSLQTPESLSAYLNLSPNLVRRCLEFLCDTGLLERRDQKFVIGKSSLHLDKCSPLVAKHHLNWRIKGMEALNELRDSNLHYTSVISLSEADIEKVREALLKAIESIRSTVNESKEETLACYSLDFFQFKNSIL